MHNRGVVNGCNGCIGSDHVSSSSDGTDSKLSSRILHTHIPNEREHTRTNRT